MKPNLENSRQPFQPTIKEGATGEEVIILQDKLKIVGYYDASITGSFDDYTKKAVLKFQKEYNLNITGMVDEETWQTLYQLTTPSAQLLQRETKPVLKLGSTGPYVTELQTILTNLLYYTNAIDGNFGSTTQTAVKAFQVNNRLTPDGIVGRDTWSALEILYSPLAICEGNGSETISYTVVAGDSLWSIAQRFSTTVAAIKQLNNLTSDVILVGQTLLIPANNSTPNPPSSLKYTVVAGDSLWSIARRFSTTVDEIKRLNNLTSDLLAIGQSLLIPNNTNESTYTVVAGDSLWSIAKKFNTTVDAIKRLNNLTSDQLSIGQQLMIPANRSFAKWK